MRPEIAYIPPGATRHSISANTTPTLWTGAWWSVGRVALAAAAASGLPLYSLPAVAALALGWRARLAAIILLGCWMATRSGSGAMGLALPVALLIQIRVPGDPYGSWDRRGRPDPGTDWYFPLDAWLLAVVGCAWIGAGWHWLLAVPPALIPPRRAVAPDLVEFDGECALCNGFVRLLIAEGGDRFRFRGTAIGASVIVGNRTRSEAVLYLAERLGGPWRVIGVMGHLIPRYSRDKLYDAVAQRRRRLDGVCIPIPPHLRHLFTD